MRHFVILAALAATPIPLISAASACPGPTPTIGISGPLTSRSKAPKQVEIKTDDDLTLSGDFYLPSGKGSAPAALLVHDAGEDRTQLVKVAERLQKSGFAVLAIDLRGHGSSKSKAQNWTGLSENAQHTLWAHAPRDLEAAAGWLRKQDGIHRTNLSLIGNGAGCALAVRHATRDENVRCVALIGPHVKNFGFDVASDILEIEGLPTFVFATREDEATERMVQEANSSGGGYSFIDLEFASNKSKTALEDKRTPSKVASWVKGVAVPRKGKG